MPTIIATHKLSSKVTPIDFGRKVERRRTDSVSRKYKKNKKLRKDCKVRNITLNNSLAQWNIQLLTNTFHSPFVTFRSFSL